jgi:hypothetical protein
MALGPAEVHPEEHLRPVRRLGAAGARADREERRPLVVLAGEQERGPFTGEVGLERGGLAVELGGQLGIVGLGDELGGRLEVVDPSEQRLPQLDLGAQAVGFAEDLLRDPLVVPEAGFDGQRVELCDARFLGREVKDAPRST